MNAASLAAVVAGIMKTQIRTHPASRRPLRDPHRIRREERIRRLRAMMFGRIG